MGLAGCATTSSRPLPVAPAAPSTDGVSDGVSDGARVTDGVSATDTTDGARVSDEVTVTDDAPVTDDSGLGEGVASIYSNRLRGRRTASGIGPSS